MLALLARIQQLPMFLSSVSATRIGSRGGLTAILLLLHSLYASPALIAAGQQVREVQGTVRDETSGVLGGATVTLIDQAGEPRTLQTDGRGTFRFADLRPGTYELRVTLDGFLAHSVKLDLTRPLERDIDVTLRFAFVFAEKLQVVGSSPQSLMSRTLSGSDLESLPDDPRRMLQQLNRMALMMGVDSVSISVDGGDIRGLLPSKEDIQMIRINANAFAAEFAAPGESEIDIITKPGSGRLRGEFSTTFADELLNARNPFSTSRPSEQTREYEFSIGTPLVQSRWGISGYAQRSEDDTNEVIAATVLREPALVAQPFRATVRTPQRDSYVSIRSTYLAHTNHVVTAGYSHSRSNGRNQGVGDYDLPERAYTNSSRSHTARFALNSILGGGSYNELSGEVRRSQSGSEALLQSPAISVSEAFIGGGNQDALSTRSRSVTQQFSDAFTYLRGKMTLRSGVQVYAVSRRSTDRSNTGGTFVFGGDVERDSTGAPIVDASGTPVPIGPLENYRRTLLNVPGYGPTRFSIIQGGPSAALSQTWVAGFSQADWVSSSNLTLSTGVRVQHHPEAAQTINVAPRAGVAWIPSWDPDAVVRAGAGLFYGGIPWDILYDVQRYQGERRRELIVQRPGFFPDVPLTFAGGTTPVETVHVTSSEANASRGLQTTLYYQRDLFFDLSGAIGYAYQRGTNILRSRLLGVAPDPSGLPGEEPRLLFESNGRASSHELKLRLYGDFGDLLDFYVSYTLARAWNDADDVYSLPADQNRPGDEFGPSAGDRRHRVYLEGTLSLPWGVEVNPALSISSSRPFNITTGQDNNADTLLTDRPSFASGGTGVITAFGVLNPNPLPGEAVIPRNFGRQPGTVYLSGSIAKRFELGHPSLTVTVEGSNLLNRINLSRFNGVLTSPSFGGPTSADDGRQLTLRARVGF